MKPLNGTKTHPLTAHALEALSILAVKPRPYQEFNPGIKNRLFRENLVEEVMLPSPYATHKGRDIAHMKITDAGIAALDNAK